MQLPASNADRVRFDYVHGIRHPVETTPESSNHSYNPLANDLMLALYADKDRVYEAVALSHLRYSLTSQKSGSSSKVPLEPPRDTDTRGGGKEKISLAHLGEIGASVIRLYVCSLDRRDSLCRSIQELG